jgi:hypothetical protein
MDRAHARRPAYQLPPRPHSSASRTTRTQTPQRGGSDDDDNDAATPATPGDSTPSCAPQHSDIFVASFGVTGEVYHSTALRVLGIDDAALKPLLAAIHLHVVRETCNILSTRRKLDALLQPQPQQQPASARGGEG